MNALYRLPQSQHRAAVAHALPHLFVVRSSLYPAHRDDAGAAEGRTQQVAHQGAYGLDGHGTQRAADPAVGGWGGSAACTDWPGRSAGIRSPEQDETPLSAAEVMHAAHMGLCSSESPAKPPQRVFVSRGGWAIDSAGAQRASWFDGLVTA